MAIVFHCEHCQRRIEAGDREERKKAKCPGCQKAIRIPHPETDDEEIHLAPLDDDEEAQRKRLMAETYDLTQNILDEKTAPEVASDEIPPEPGAASFLIMPTMDEAKLQKTIIRYLCLMAEGDLDQAATLAETIVPEGFRATTILEQIALQQIADERLAAIPPQVLSGLIRNLRTQVQ